MTTTEILHGYEVRVVRSKAGVAREATVQLGDPSRAGLRAKDAGSARPRKAARVAVAAALGMDLRKVHAAARYSCLTAAGGYAVRRDGLGGILGAYRL